MIHQLLAIKKPLIAVDTETTSVDVQEARIVELAFQVWDVDGLKKEWRSLINPLIPIPLAASEIHHITDALVNSCRVCSQSRETCECSEFRTWPTFAQLAPNLAKGFTDVDFCGQNVRYDLRILSAEFTRSGVEWNYSGARIVDSSRLEALGEPRSLSALYEKHTGQKLDGAHGAAADVEASRMVIEAQLKRYQMLPRDLDSLHEAQWQGWIDTEGKFRFVNGVPTCMFGKWNGKPMRSIEKGYFDWLLKSDFSAEIKKLASDAKLVVYPEVKK